MIGKVKRFKSKNFREENKASNSCNTQRRRISIVPVKQVTTVVKKTFTTLIETESHIEFDSKISKH